MEWTMMPPGAGIWYLRAGTLEALAKHSLIFGAFGPPSSELKAYLMGDESRVALVLQRIALSNRTNEESWEYVERQESMPAEVTAWPGARTQWIRHPILGVWRGGVFAISECSAAATDARELARVARERQLAWLYLHDEHNNDEQLALINAQLNAERWRSVAEKYQEILSILERDHHRCPARVVEGDPHVWGYFETSIDQERCRYCDVVKQEGRHQ